MNSNQPSPRFWNLFLLMREARMPLTLEQLDHLHQAQQQGYDLDNLETLKKISRLLWVKPSDRYSEDRFNRAFDLYCQQYQAKRQPSLPTPPPQPPQASPPPTPSSPKTTPDLPQEPPKDSPKIPIGVKTTQPSRKNYKLFLTQFPMTSSDLQKFWKSLSHSVSQGTTTELDLDKTLRRFQQEGIYSDVVLRSRQIARCELFLLIDESNAMIPFMPMLRPLIESLVKYRLTLTYTYRFTRYPEQYLYQWRKTIVAEAITSLLPKLHHNRTLALILSDAGAASRSYNIEQVQKIADFLYLLRPNIHQWLWINPLPRSRWQGTSAQAIANLPGGQMIELDELRSFTYQKQLVI